MTTFPPPGFRRFWAGEAVSGLGTYAALLALQTLVVLDLGGGPTETGWLSAARWLPYLLLGLVVGALVDRVRRRPVMVVTDVVRALLLGLVPVAWATGVLTLPLLLAVVVAYGAASLVNDAASMSFLPRLVPRGQLQRAHARIDGADAVAQTAGPALGGVLARAVGAPLALLTASLGYLVSAVAVLTLRTEEPAGSPRGGGARRLRREVAEGVRWVYGASGLRRLAVATHLWFAANAVLVVVLAPLALRQLGLSVAVFGVVTAVAGLGALVGAVASTAVGRRLGTGGAIIAAHVSTVLGVLLTAAAVLPGTAVGAAVVLAAGQAFHGVGLGTSNSHEMTYRQAITPDAMQARTNTTMRSLNRAVVVVVSPLAGLLAVQVGQVAALLVAAAVFTASVLALLFSPVRTARIEEGEGPGAAHEADDG